MYLHSNEIAGLHVYIGVHKSVELFVPYLQPVYIDKILDIRKGSFKSIHCLGKLVQIPLELPDFTTLLYK